MDLDDQLREVVKMIEHRVYVQPKPAVYISGGLDSTILLHHLKEKTKREIYTYTFGWTYHNEFDHARSVAEYYGTIHREIVLDGWLSRFPEFLRTLDKPRFNLQPFFLAETAMQDGRLTGYCAEGLDESFGGYWYKKMSYHEAFADHYIYIKPVWEEAHKHFGLDLEMPFSDLPPELTLPLWDSTGNKHFLRKAYEDRLPEFVLKRRKNSASPNWKELWRREMCELVESKTDEDIRRLLNLWATQEWLKFHSLTTHVMAS